MLRMKNLNWKVFLWYFCPLQIKLNSRPSISRYRKALTFDAQKKKVMNQPEIFTSSWLWQMEYKSFWGRFFSRRRKSKYFPLYFKISFSKLVGPSLEFAHHLPLIIPRGFDIKASLSLPGTQAISGLPVNPSGQKQTGLWLDTKHCAFFPQLQGFTQSLNYSKSVE